MTYKTPCFLVLLMLAFTSCRKSKNTGNCTLRLTGVSMPGGMRSITYNEDGTIKSLASNEPLKYFNRGKLIEYARSTDTVILDSLGRLLHFKQPFNSGRQTAEYFYDLEDRVVRTVTQTGTGLDYLQDLTYEHDDVIDMVYNVGFTMSNPTHFKYTYYDTVCNEQYLSMAYWPQIGWTRNKHLLKTMSGGNGIEYFSYKFDAKGKIVAAYRNYDNSGWTPSRTTDTTIYTYTCD